MNISEMLIRPEGKTLEFKRDISSLKPILKTLDKSGDRIVRGLRAEIRSQKSEVGGQGEMKAVLVTGAKGFVGRNLVVVLKRRGDVEVIEYDIDSPPGTLDEGLLTQRKGIKPSKHQEENKL